MRRRVRVYKFQRQNLEYKRQLGRKLISEEYDRVKSIVNDKNKDQVNKMFLGNVKGIKRKYNVTNVCKAERCWRQFYNENRFGINKIEVFN